MSTRTSTRTGFSTRPVISVLTWLVSALVAVPILFVILSLFSPDNGSWQHLIETTLPSYVGNTLMLMLLVFIFSTSIGVTTAWLIAATRFPGRSILSWALVLPLAAPAYIVAYVYTDLLEYAGPIQSLIREITGWTARDYWFPAIRSLPGAALMLSLVLYPYIYLFARSAFAQRSTTLFEAARTLGKSPFAAFRQVALPAARPAIAGGTALVLMETVADYGVVDYFGVPTFSTGIFRTWFAMGEQQAALKLTAMMFLVVALLVVLERLSRRGEVSTSNVKDGTSQPVQLGPIHAGLAIIACSVPVIVGAIIPVFILANYALTTGDPELGRNFWPFVMNSLTAASLAAAVATIVALFLAYAQRLNPNKINQYATHVSTLGYALPGTMIAIGLLAPLSSLDKNLAAFMGNTFDISTGLIFTGTIAALIYAYVIRFMTVAYNACHSGLDAIHGRLDDAARTLGARPITLFGRIHLPLMRNSVLAALMLVFVDVMRELPATLILRPFNFETLATRVYRLASDERLPEASAAALTIVMIGLVPVLVASLLTRGTRAKS